MYFMLYAQVIGWSMWFSEYLFLERNWVKDESTLKVCFSVSLPQIYGCILFSILLPHPLPPPNHPKHSFFIYLIGVSSFGLPLFPSFESCGTISAVRSPTSKRLPSTLLASSLCRRNSIYTG